MDNTHTYRTNSAEETQRVGKTVANSLVSSIKYQVSRKEGLVICLYGDLGSGKTTFTQGFIQALGIEGRILSPTFTLVREYPLPSGITLHHFDLYRLKELDETINMQELIRDPSAILLIEWADRMNGRLPEHRIDIEFTTEEDEHHTITVKNIGEI